MKHIEPTVKLLKTAIDIVSEMQNKELITPLMENLYKNNKTASRVLKDIQKTPEKDRNNGLIHYLHTAIVCNNWLLSLMAIVKHEEYVGGTGLYLDEILEPLKTTVSPNPDITPTIPAPKKKVYH